MEKQVMTIKGKLKRLAAQSNQIETTLAQLDSCLHFMRETGNKSDFLMMKTNSTSSEGTHYSIPSRHLEA